MHKLMIQQYAPHDFHFAVVWCVPICGKDAIYERLGGHRVDRNSRGLRGVTTNHSQKDDVGTERVLTYI